MHGIIFVTWEKYLAERFGSSLLSAYRTALGETSANAPLASRVYSDEQLLAGLETACRLTLLPANVLLHEYGRYFIINGLTGHLCAYLLRRVRTGRDLLLVMRNAHGQLRRIPDGLTPPLFEYEPSSNPHKFTLIYDSPRKLCPLLFGAIEGAAELYGQRVYIAERSCMKRGAAVCRFEVQFIEPETRPDETDEQRARRRFQQILEHQTLQLLPDQEGISLLDLYKLLQNWQEGRRHIRISMVLEALNHLQHAGLVASTANQPGDDLMRRRYWRVPTNF